MCQSPVACGPAGGAAALGEGRGAGGAEGRGGIECVRARCAIADETLAAATSGKVYRRGAWETRLLRTPFEYRPLTDDAMSFSTLAS